MSKSMYLTVLAGIAALLLGACDKRAGDQPPASDSSAVTDNRAAAASPGDARIVSIDAGDEGFKPSRVEVKTGQATTLRFTRTSDKTCADKVVFPDIALEKDLPLNRPVDVKVPTDKSRTLVFQCGMGMYKSSVVIN